MARKLSPADCPGSRAACAQSTVPFQQVRPLARRSRTAVVPIATFCQHSSISQVYAGEKKKKNLPITQYSSKIFVLDPYAYRSMFFQPFSIENVEEAVLP